jgi:hypothetical protein
MWVRYCICIWGCIWLWYRHCVLLQSYLGDHMNSNIQYIFYWYLNAVKQGVLFSAHNQFTNAHKSMDQENVMKQGIVFHICN